MSAQILDGKIVRDKIAEKLKTINSKLETKPKLVIIQVGDLPESNAYIRQKVLFGEKIGAIVEHLKLDENTDQETLNSKLLTLNSDPSVHGIIVQMPIPKHLDKDAIIESIDPAKDVDGQTAVNIKNLFENRVPRPEGRGYLIFAQDSPHLQLESESFFAQNKKAGFIPATTKGILTLLNHYQIPVHGKNITVVGRSFLVGKPTALALINLDATVTVCHSRTKKLPEKTKNADILIVAAGKANLIKDFHVNRDQVVVDVGINIVEDEQKTGPWKSSSQGKRPGLELSQKPESEPSSRQLIGDVDFEEVSKIVAAITPVPGGIGPMTVASLFENLLEAYKKQA